MDKYFFWTVFIGLLLSCTDQTSENMLELNQSGEYSISLDHHTSPVEEYSQYLPSWKGQEAFALHVRIKDQVKIYSLETGQLFDSIKYESSGPRALPGIYDFHIVNPNTIFLNQRYGYKLYMVNDAVEILQEYNFLPDNVPLDPVSKIPQSNQSFLPVFDNHRLAKKIGTSLYLTGSPDRNFYAVDYVEAENLIVKLDLLTGEFASVQDFPEMFKGSAWGPFHLQHFGFYCENKDEFIISFGADENIYFKDKEFNLLASHQATSTMMEGIRPITAGSSAERYYDHYMTTPVFGPVLYDRFQNLYYRIGKLPRENYEPFRMKDPLLNPRDLMVLVFDGDFSKVSELVVRQPDEGIYHDLFFVNKKGLNIGYVDFQDEDKLIFKTFAVVP